jgi:hypothetical protein
MIGMGFFVAFGLVAIVMSVLIARFAVADGRYDTAVRALAGRPSLIEDADSPLAVMRAVNADVADRTLLDDRVATGAIDDPLIQELYRVRSLRLRQAIVGGAASFVVVIMTTFLVNFIFGV